MSKVSIKLGDPQPVNCDRCRAKYGYQIEQQIRTLYVTRYHPDGYFESGDYGGPIKTLQHKLIPYCANCLNTLNFNIKHN